MNACTRFMQSRIKKAYYSHQHRPSNQDLCSTCIYRHQLEQRVKLERDLNQRLQHKNVGEACRAAIGFSIVYMLAKVWG